MATNNEAPAVIQPVAGSIDSTATVGVGASGSITPQAPATTAASSGTPASAVSTTTQTGLLGTLANLASGVAGYVPASSSLTVNGQSLSQSQILALLNGYITSGNAVGTSRSQWKANLAAWDGQQSNARAFALELKAVIIQALGKQSPLLAYFGLSPPKQRAKLNTQKLAVRNAKNQATRTLRGTKGARQKAAIQYQGPVQISVSTPGQADGQGGSGTASSIAPAAPAAAQPSTTTTAVQTAVKSP